MLNCAMQIGSLSVTADYDGLGSVPGQCVWDVVDKVALDHQHDTGLRTDIATNETLKRNNVFCLKCSCAKYDSYC